MNVLNLKLLFTFVLNFCFKCRLNSPNFVNVYVPNVIEIMHLFRAGRAHAQVAQVASLD